MKTVSVFFAAAALLALSSELVGAGAGRGGVQVRSGTVAFLRTAGTGPAGLFASRADGSGLRRLTPGVADIASFEWAPDGSRIAYLDRQGALRLVRPDGTGRVLLAASSPLRHPWSLSWSPDGKAIAVIAYDPAEGPVNPSRGLGHRRIYLIPTGRGEPRRLPGGYVGWELSWSPRGDEIAYASASGQALIIGTDGNSKARFVTRQGKPALGTPVWSPDATHLGFQGLVRHGRYVDRYAGIYVADADTSNLHLVTGHAYNEYGFAWSPDGRWILYGRANRQGIYVIGADGRNNHRLTRDSPTQSSAPALSWAPDGRSIAYETDGTGNGDIYLIDADGHNKVQLTSSPEGDTHPAWQPR